MVKKAGTLKDLKTRKRKAGGVKQSKTKVKKAIEINQITRSEKLLEVEIKNKTGYKINTKSVGRPTKYKKEYAKGMLEYFENHIKDGYYDEYITEEFVGKFGELKKKISYRPKPPPTFEGYSAEIGVDDGTLRNWATDRKDGLLLNPEFFVSYKRCLSIQKRMLKDLGVTGQYNSNIAKLLLSAEHSIFEERLDQKETESGKKTLEINEKDLDEELSEFYNK